MNINQSEKSSAAFYAEVVSTDKFVEKGYIGVYVEGIDFRELDHTKEGTPCMIMTPYGGLDKMGMIACPPIGSAGLVMYPGGDLSNMPVWIGSTLVRSDLNALKDDDAKEKIPPEVQDPTDIVLKTQYTKKDNLVLNKEDNKVENLIKLNEESVILAHVRQDDYENYEYENGNILAQPVNSLVIKDDSITINLKLKGNSESAANFFKITEEGISLNFVTDKVQNTIKLTESGITLDANGKSTIVIGADGIISIDGEKEVRLNGSSDNVTKWTGFNDFVDVFNSHTHMTSEGPSSDNLNKWTQAGDAKATKVKVG